jgi:TPR repeat protein
MNDYSRNLIGAFAIAIALCTPAAAGPLEDGDAAYRDNDYAKAIELWQPLAERGDPTAQYFIGTLYAEGKGFPQNDETAFAWFQRSANKGHPVAQYNVGASYAAGAGVMKSDTDAAKWFQRAANQGMPYAQLNLGLMYAAGSGVPQDDVEAFKWLELAFTGFPPGGVRMDVAKAMADVGAKLTVEQKDEAKRRERAWKALPEGK